MGLVTMFVAAIIAGVINSMAGGGTLLTFPALLWVGVPAIAANATNTVALWPGSVGSVWGYRRELASAQRQLFALVVPSVAGGLVGALLLHLTPATLFERLVPWLILFATCLFMAQEPIQRRFDFSQAHAARSPWLSWTMVFQFAVGVYGGYFGAGIGILMLAALSLIGHTDIHQMNAVKTLLAVSVNGVAALYLALAGLVVWPYALLMAAGAIAGGVAGPGVARRVGRTAVRRVVIAVGFGMALASFLS